MRVESQIHGVLTTGLYDHDKINQIGYILNFTLCCFRAVVISVFFFFSLFTLGLRYCFPLLLIFSSCQAKHINLLQRKFQNWAFSSFCCLFVMTAHFLPIFENIRGYVIQKTHMSRFYFKILVL